MRRIPAALALLALAGGLVSVASSPASAEESDLIDIEGVLTLDLLSLGLDAKVDVAGTGVVDASVAVGP
jgi:hypothetical protein